MENGENTDELTRGKVRCRRRIGLSAERRHRQSIYRSRLEGKRTLKTIEELLEALVNTLEDNIEKND